MLGTKTGNDGWFVPALVEGVDLHPVMRVLLYDLLCVLIRVEGIHEHQRYVCVVGLVQVLWRELASQASMIKCLFADTAKDLVCTANLGVTTDGNI